MCCSGTLSRAVSNAVSKANLRRSLGVLTHAQWWHIRTANPIDSAQYTSTEVFWRLERELVEPNYLMTIPMQRAIYTDTKPGMQLEDFD